MTQIVVMKAWEGFADRLQVLSNLITYCLKHKAFLCIDWRDENWGQGRWDFHDFFEIIGIPVVTLETVNMIVGAKIVPSCWAREYIAQPMNRLFLGSDFTGPDMCDNQEKIEGDIIVTNGRGVRKFDGQNIVNNLRFKKPVAELIQQRLSNFYLPATVVHLRGTDRFKPELINTWFEKFDNLMPHCKARVYHISDSQSLIDDWVKKVPHSKLCNKNSTILKIPNSTKQGTHQLSHEALEFYGITKYDLIIDALADFMALTMATDGIGLEKSTFFEMARLLFNYGPDLISRMLHGYRPARKSLLGLP